MRITCKGGSYELTDKIDEHLSSTLADIGWRFAHGDVGGGPLYQILKQPSADPREDRKVKWHASRGHTASMIESTTILREQWNGAVDPPVIPIRHRTTQPRLWNVTYMEHTHLLSSKENFLGGSAGNLVQTLNSGSDATQTYYLFVLGSKALIQQLVTHSSSLLLKFQTDISLSLEDSEGTDFQSSWLRNCAQPGSKAERWTTSSTMTVLSNCELSIETRPRNWGVRVSDATPGYDKIFNGPKWAISLQTATPIALWSPISVAISLWIVTVVQGPFHTIHCMYAVRRPHFLLKLIVTFKHVLDSGKGPRNTVVGHRPKKHYVIR